MYTINTGDAVVTDFIVSNDLCTWQDATLEQLTGLNAGSVYDTIWFTVFSSDNHDVVANDIKPISPPSRYHYIHFNDTTGLYNVSLLASDHGCKSNWVTKNNVVNVRGAIISSAKKINCKTPFDYSFYTEKHIDTDSTVWNIYKYDTLYPYGTMTHAKPSAKLIYSSIDNLDVLNYKFASRGDYKIETISFNYTDKECSDTSIIEWVPVRNLKVDFNPLDFQPCKSDELIFDNALPNNAQDMIAQRVKIKNGTFTAQALLTSNENIANIGYKVNETPIIFSEKGATTIWFYGSDINGCSDSVSKIVFVNQPQALFEVVNSSNCLPFTSTFTDKSTSVAKIVSRTWTTNGDTALFEAGNKTKVADVYSQPGKKSPSLTVADEFGCISVFTLNDVIEPLIPDARFSLVNSKICSYGYAAINLPDSVSAIYTKSIDSLVWFFDGYKTQTTSQGQRPDSMYYASVGDKSIIAKAYSHSPDGNICYNADTMMFKVVDVKIRLPFDGTNICKSINNDAVLWLTNDSIYSGLDSIKAIKWFVDDVIFPTKNLFAENIRLSKIGRQEVKMQLTSDYVGCESMSDSIIVNVYDNNISITIDKDTICVGEEIKVSFSNQEFLKTVPHYWLMGNGDRIDGILTDISYIYKSLPDVQNLIVKFKVDEDAKVNTTACRSIEASDNLMIYPVEVDFIRGENDALVKGCAFTVDFINKSAGSDNSYLWTIDTLQSSNSNEQYTFTEPNKIYEIKLDLLNNNCTQSKIKQVATFPLPSVDLVADKTNICANDTVSLNVTGNFALVKTWSWDGNTFSVNNTSVVKPFTQSTMVSVNVESTDNCVHSDSVYIVCQIKPYYTGAPEGGLLYVFSEDSLLLLTDEKSSQLVVNEIFNLNNDSLSGVSYRWEPMDYLSCSRCYSPFIDLSCGGENGSVSDCMSLPDVLEYTVYMSDSLGCFTNVTEKISFDVFKNTKLGMPTAFSPNGDGLNDKAFARGWAVVEFHSLQIYNRWGQLVFESADIEDGWDGTFNGNPQQAGSYAYILKGADSSKEDIMIKGYITLIR
ncbi:MAG: gliding motility-associated C-terminal domain-containing protein [Bacteroidales bacterium]|nr:gliding motility-associated C-terminal domain-containing protein [Bacteroidales bacterium]